nr:squalene/phytoene synthase family protein [bacterium]
DDEQNDIATKQKQFLEFDNMFEKCFSNAEIDDKMFTALQFVVKKYELSKEHLYDIVKGVRSDLFKTHYETFAELYDYCFKVASKVAYVCIELFVPKSERTADLFKYGENLGIALQLTNILRDIKEDHSKKRRYIPKEWLKKFGMDENEYEKYLECNDIEKLNPLLSFIKNLAENYYSECEKHINKPQKKYLFTLEIIKNIYYELLKKISYDYNSILNGRISLSFYFKLWTALKIKLFL